MKYLFVGDLQEGVHLLDTILAVAETHEAIPTFVGDYLDSFSSKPAQQVRALERILDLVEQGKAAALYANHEVSYWHPRMRCSGYSGLTQGLITPLLQRMRTVLASHIWLAANKVLVTHAGVSSYWRLAANLRDPERFPEDLTVAARDFPNSWFYAIGGARGGMDLCGGPLWCDWTEEFKPFPGIRQVVGHTPVRGYYNRARTAGPDGWVAGARFKMRFHGYLCETDNGDWNIDCLSSPKPAVLLFDPETDSFTPIELP